MALNDLLRPIALTVALISGCASSQPQPSGIRLPHDCNQMVTYETVQLGETFQIKGVLAEHITPMVEVRYKQRGTQKDPWNFEGRALSGEVAKKTFGKRNDIELWYHRFTVGDDYIFFFNDRYPGLPQDAVRVASAPESCMSAIDLKLLYSEADIERAKKLK